MTVRRYVCTFAIALLVASTWSTHLYSSEALIEDAIFYDMELVSVEVDGVEQTDLSEYEEGIAPRAIFGFATEVLTGKWLPGTAGHIVRKIKKERFVFVGGNEF